MSPNVHSVPQLPAFCVWRRASRPRRARTPPTPCLGYRSGRECRVVPFAASRLLSTTSAHIYPPPCSQAEITTGVICSCLPTLPALYRHYAPKDSSMRHPSGRREGLDSHTVKAPKHSILSSFRMAPSTRYQDHDDDPRLLRAEYLELGGVSGDERGGAELSGPVTTKIEGGADASSDWAATKSEGVGPLHGDGQCGRWGGITKTVCLESVPQRPMSTQGIGAREP